MSKAILQFFNEKVDRLDQLSFTKFVREQDLKVTVSGKVGERVTVELINPEMEATEAFVLTLRFFLQDNESISLRNIAQLYETLPVSDELKARVREARAKFNEQLDAPCLIQAGPGVLTNRRLLETFLYGHLAHANAEKKAEFDRWSQSPLLLPILQLAFYGLLIKVFGFLLWVKHQNLLALDELGSNATPV